MFPVNPCSIVVWRCNDGVHLVVVHCNIINFPNFINKKMLEDGLKL